MSLAIYAAPFNEEENNDLISKRKYQNIAKRRNTTLNDSKVTSMLQEIHNQSVDEDEEFGDFNPPPKPESSGVEKTNTSETTFVRNNEPKPIDMQDTISANTYASNLSTTNNSVDDFYKIPPPSKEFNAQYYNNSPNNNNELLMKKLNYMIHLLEEQQDERTSNVTEEVIMYSFLGIFIIFIVDSFVRVGKYVR